MTYGERSTCGCGGFSRSIMMRLLLLTSIVPTLAFLIPAHRVSRTPAYRGSSTSSHGLAKSASLAARAVSIRRHARGPSPPPLACAGRDTVLDQDSTPLVDALAAAAGRVRAPLFYPGHKMGSGASERFVEVLLGGKLDVLRHDLPELPELDNLFAPEGPIRDAERLAADAFGASKTWLLANGSTCGVIASIIACVQRHKSRIPPCPDDSRSIDWDKQAEVARETEGAGLLRRSVVILPRDAHKSAVHGLVISGATPCFLAPVLHPESGVRLGIGKDSLKAALEEHGDEVAAVLLVSPTYEGACADVASAARACHAAGVPLVVDEAHGAHLSFLGPDENGTYDTPRGALQCGADLVVQSAHKTLESLTQSAFLHLGEGMLSTSDTEFANTRSAERAVSDALALVQSSSPSYLLLASLDATRWSVASTEAKGKRRLGTAVQVARAARDEIAGEPGVHVLDLETEDARAAGFVGTDPLRLTVSFDGGIGGYEADEMLIEEHGVYSELPAPDSVTFVFGPGSTAEHGKILTEALRHIGREATNRQALEEAAGAPAKPTMPDVEMILARQIYTPREAFFAPSKTVSAREAVGLASAETVCPYPPGIPTLLPGEAITHKALDILEAVKAGGGVISGCTDPSLTTMRVIDSPALDA